MKKAKIFLPPPGPNGLRLITRNGIKYIWIPNPRVKYGGYWRKINF